jgi:predicted NACHT family NTPase
VRDLFHGRDIEKWKNRKGELHLFLDSLDECLLRIDTLSALLLDEIKKCPTDRLFLRITCRTAEWPNLLESGLRELWDEREVAAYELAPLRKKDVAEAARENGLDATTFLEHIETSGVVPFAIKPVTLEFLI